MSLIDRGNAFGNFVPQMVALLQDGTVDKEAVLDIARATWVENARAADDAYVPGEFTTFAALRVHHVH